MRCALATAADSDAGEADADVVRDSAVAAGLHAAQCPFGDVKA